MKKQIIVSIIIITLTAFLAGLIVSYSELLSINKIINPYNKISNQDNVNVEEKDFSDIDVNSLIHLSNSKDILDKKVKLVDFIWKGKGFPIIHPSSIEENVDDLRYKKLNNLEKINKITISMENNVNSIAYLFLAQQSNNKLVIYHEGHMGDFYNGINTIQFFLDHGYSVLAFSMPLLGMNSQPQVDTYNFGKIKLVSHDQFYFLESQQFSPIKYFVEPIAISLNYLDKNYDFDSYSMIGLSGGGWTTILYAAIDDRVSQTYSVAGSLPFHLRYTQSDVGDYEQNLPQLYTIANYLELYILGSFGDERKLIQIFNIYDPCCFAGKLSKSYEKVIQTKLTELKKGTFEIYLDDTHKEHKISANALKIIINHMQQL